MIETENLEKFFENDGVVTPVLHNVSLKISEGEFVAIMGPSGSGKSTLLHVLGFLDAPTGGLYKFENKDADSYSENEKAFIRNRHVGFVFQSFNLLPKTTVLENVMLPLLYSAIPEKEWTNLAKDAIESVGLAHRMNHDSALLSGGEKQRVAIARAIVTKPKIIFADEPTGNLDSKSGQTIMRILEDLNDKGQTIILITHETYTAEHAGRIIRVLDGTVESDEVVNHRRTSRDEFIK
ncbi:MAG: ABC transporter ATP-binding protein [Candidatus Taylorbacteria bacterium]|nr:ABC transporter ATP-binding protein [Candidatus Taylorbacteria bacterium]